MRKRICGRLYTILLILKIMNVVICLEKFSDWLEAYSIFCYFKGIEEVKVLYIENARNNEKAVKDLFGEFKSKISFEYEAAEDRGTWFKRIGTSRDTGRW